MKSSEGNNGRAVLRDSVREREREKGREIKRGNAPRAQR
jgi:hypothetical protein